MLNNYHYFIALSEELNIAKAAKRLYISHQRLSKYLKNLEQHYHVTLFERAPKSCLTPAGEVYLETLLQIQFLEENLKNQFSDIRLAQKGNIRFGTTEGRYRILVPDLLSDFQKLYPDVILDAQYGTSYQLQSLVLKNELDLVLLNEKDIKTNQFDLIPIFREHLYIVISDNMLSRYFPEQYPECKETFKDGVDLSLFQTIPFILSRRGFRSRETLETFLTAKNLSLNCVKELTQHDIHFMMAIRDYAAAFCWSMYLQSINQLSLNSKLNNLNVFPIKGLTMDNQVVIATKKGRILPTFSRDLINLVKQICSTLSL